MERINTLENSMLNNIKMASVLCGVKDLDEGMELMEKFLPRIRNCYELYICLYQNWNAVSPHIQEITSSQEEYTDAGILIMPFAYQNGKRLHQCSFTKRGILPDYIYTRSQSSYVFSPLFFHDREFGYLALSFRENQLAYQFDFLTWIVNVSRMLNTICESRQTDLLVNHLGRYLPHPCHRTYRGRRAGDPPECQSVSGTLQPDSHQEIHHPRQQRLRAGPCRKCI